LEPTRENFRWVNAQRSRGVLGVIGDFIDPATESLLDHLKVPKINTSVQTRETTMIRVAIDNPAIGRLAARYFIDLGFRNFAYVGSEAFHWSQLRCEGFREVVSAQRSSMFHSIEMSALSAKVLRRLARPLALLAADDLAANQVLELARKAKLRLPSDLAVLGVNNDEVLCEMGVLPLSSVADNGRQIGIEAMNILYGIRHGRKPPAETLVPPNGVVSRMSTEVAAIGDAEVVAAMSIIQNEACEGLTVEKLLRRVNLSRGTLERRFRQAVGRSLFEEIREVRFETARRLLATTQLKVSAVGRRCGYRDPKRFTKEFHVKTGMTPTQWRGKHGGA
jgi:LacI family transcriptional regulator